MTIYDTSASSSYDSDIGAIVHKVLFQLHSEIESKGLKVESDVNSLLDSKANHELVFEAIQCLLQHAIHSSPNGSELSVTLIDGNYQWELEVADSSNQNRMTIPEMGEAPQVPDIIDRFVVNAHRVALQLGGQIQKWNCPQGGVANVLVVPKSAGSASIRPAV